MANAACSSSTTLSIFSISTAVMSAPFEAKTLSHKPTGRSVMKQEVFMSWDRIVRSWRQLKDGIVFQCCRSADDMGTRIDLIGAEMSSDFQSGDVQTRAFRPDDRGRRREFSLHIGC
jgi:hypothetical protein